jgi:hypothetical protein
MRKLWRFLRRSIAKFRIPRGSYCYSGSRAPGSKKYRPCPYWKRREDWPDQADGYCSFLGYGDMDTNNDDTVVFTDVKTGKEIPASEMPFYVGILWDQVKECGIKDD